MDKKWKIKSDCNEDLVVALADSLGIDRTISSLLVQRNVTNYEEARLFFRPKLEHLHDPFLMKDMDAAVQRILKTVKAEEKILVYGDYDVDGTTSVALMYSFLSKMYDKLDYYIPDRDTEGYGISNEGVDYAIANGFSLVIALDCGIKAVERIKYAAQNGVDFIVCDHHLPGDEVPEAVAVLDPKQYDCHYPFKELSGCGVGFKLIQAIAMQEEIPFEEVYAYIDLVAVSIASDLVPMIGENRVLAYYGLSKLNQDPVKGLKALIDISGIYGKFITVNDIVFKIGPRINAAGRISSASKAVDLLITENNFVAQELGESINTLNDSRKGIDGDITETALNLIKNNPEEQKKKSTVLYSPDWHKGVVGIVASRLIDAYYRPTVILTKSEGKIVGSARSISGFDLYYAIDQCKELLDSYGGHKYAAGISMKPENFPAFVEKFEQIVNETIQDDQLVPQIEYDVEIELLELVPRFYRLLKQFEPYGPENMSPVFMARNVCDIGTSKIVGRNHQHLKMDLYQEGFPRKYFPGIAFNLASKLSLVKSGHPFAICFTIDENFYRGETYYQLRIQDIKENF